MCFMKNVVENFSMHVQKQKKCIENSCITQNRSDEFYYDPKTFTNRCIEIF